MQWLSFPPSTARAPSATGSMRRSSGCTCSRSSTGPQRMHVNDTSSTSKVRLALGQTKPQRPKFELIMSNLPRPRRDPTRVPPSSNFGYKVLRVMEYLKEGPHQGVPLSPDFQNKFPRVVGFSREGPQQGVPLLPNVGSNKASEG